jgi:hypothetical protein
MLDLMSGLLGAPNDRIWPGLRALPHAERYRLPPQPYNYLRKVRPRCERCVCCMQRAAVSPATQHPVCGSWRRRPAAGWHAALAGLLLAACRLLRCAAPQQPLLLCPGLAQHPSFASWRVMTPIPLPPPSPHCIRPTTNHLRLPPHASRSSPT